MLRKLTWVVFISYLVSYSVSSVCLICKRFLKEFSVPANIMLDGKLF